MKKNKLNLPTTNWNEDIEELSKGRGTTYRYDCKKCSIEVVSKFDYDPTCPQCDGKLQKIDRCMIPYFHDSNDMPCKKCHVGGRLSWWWKVIKSWYYKI